MIAAVFAVGTIMLGAAPPLDCRLGYRTLAARLAHDASLAQDPPTAQHPWRELRSPPGDPARRLDSVAAPGAEGYPAIVQRLVTRDEGGATHVALSVCCWGAARECRNLKQDLEAAAVRLEQGGALP